MALASITDLTAAAANSSNPFFVPPLSIGLGGIDPLGLRQINFDLMDKVLPGLNNVARHVRPFVVVTWAWHRAAVVAREQGRSVVKEDQILDFVDRVDVIYVWSQFLRDANADLPGRQVLDPLIHADRWVFDGPNWHARRKVRRLSTALMAPINYGPALKTMGWIEQHQYHPNVFLPSAAAAPAVAAFEHQISGFINAPAFNRFGPMDVAAADVGSWAEAWALDKPTEAERAIMRDMFMGSNAPSARRKGCNLMLAAARENADPNPELEQIRAAMAGAPSSFVPSGELDETQVAWRRVQVRQLFRLALEALLYWASLRLRDGAKMTNVLVSEFIGEYTEGGVISPSIEWLESPPTAAGGPTELQDQIVAALRDPAGANLPQAIVAGLKMCLAEPPDAPGPLDRPDRLPLARARREAEAWAAASTSDFLRNVFESWIFAQHVYWSVGRGLADARARGKTILRLKVVLEEDGWALTPGVDAASRPLPSGDRLRTALTIATECGLIS
ncbi:MAG: septum formation inhibitor-activating ATPase [Xanthobacteraceae bacterium]